MFAYIKGTLEGKSNNYVVIEVSGIGYKIFMSETAIENLGEIGEQVKVYTHYHVREDDISLYGFLTNEELRMFELLISVSGVGAKSAITMLSNISPSSFALAVISNDTTKLVKIPGIGAKTAARIVLELKDKLKTEETINNSKASKEIKEAIKDDDKVSEAISALQVLGYNKKEIEKAFEKLDKDALSVEDLIRKGLTLLSN
jgi:Holliday junction DNA helicase RuvA